jgi:sugar phosphate isomerase/epimerase
MTSVPTADSTPSARAAHDSVFGQIRAIADVAHATRVHVAEKLNLPDIGVSFNLCHWLKVEGAERDPVPVLRAALPRLVFVSISGSDTGDTRTMSWDRLIQPLSAGNYDLGAFLRTLRTVGYTGPVGFQGYNIKGEPRDILTRSIAAWRKFNAD